MSNHRQSGYSPKIYADDRWIRWDSRKWPLERERRAHQPQPLKLPQRPPNPVLYLGHHQETCARGLTRSALLAELLQAAAALPRENPKALAALATLLQTARTSAPESLRHLASRATANKEQATCVALGRRLHPRGRWVHRARRRDRRLRMALIPQGMIAEGGGPLTIVACGLWLQLRPRERGLPLRRGHRARRRERRAHSPRVPPNKYRALSLIHI